MSPRMVKIGSIFIEIC